MQLPGLTIGIVADDLTGACDTSLQFFLGGATTEVLLDPNSIHAVDQTVQVWSLTTESRHMDIRDAVISVKRAVSTLKQKFGIENLYSDFTQYQMLTFSFLLAATPMTG